MLYIQLILEQHGLAHHRSTYMWIFGQIQYGTVNQFSLPYDFLRNIIFPQDYVIVRVQYIIHITYKMLINYLSYW